MAGTFLGGEIDVMAWREALLTTVGPGAFSGITLGDWLRVLRENNRHPPP